MPRRVRAVVFSLFAAFFLLGPVHTQVLLRPSRSNDAPWRPMAWHMYSAVGLDVCQGNFWAIRGGQRAELDRRELERSIPRVRAHGKYAMGRQVRARDIVWDSSFDLAEMSRSVCDRLGPEADVRVYARCAPGRPGGPWRPVADGTKNVCAP